MNSLLVLNGLVRVFRQIRNRNYLKATKVYIYIYIGLYTRECLVSALIKIPLTQNYILFVQNSRFLLYHPYALAMRSASDTSMSSQNGHPHDTDA